MLFGIKGLKISFIWINDYKIKFVCIIIYSKIMTQAIICSGCKKKHYESQYNNKNEML